MKNIVILGSTGSVGTQALDIITDSERYNVFGLICYGQIDKMVEQTRLYRPKMVSVFDKRHYKALVEALKDMDVQVLCGLEGSIEVCVHEEVDLVLTAIVGSAGLIPTIRSIEAGKDIALANKETLVTAGHLIMPLAKENNVTILPVDSEHSAIFQCLHGESHRDVDKLILTASGGAFRSFTKDEIKHKKAIDALKHPNWHMGPKITIDSATLMNKGLELIEAKWLFDKAHDEIEILIHPQSIVHSMVQFKDGVIMAQMGVPDMRLPIIYALDYPRRYANKVPKLTLEQMAMLTFEKPDLDRFPCLELAMEAIRVGGILPTVLNASNEVLVEAYLKDQIGFYDIAKGVEQMLAKYDGKSQASLDEILSVDLEVRQILKLK